MNNTGLRAKYTGLLLRLDKRFSGRTQFLASYALGSSVGHNTFGVNQIFNNDDWSQNYGPLDRDRRHILNVSGVVDLPKRFEVSFSSAFYSKPPFNAYVGSVDFEGSGTPNDVLPGTRVNEFNRGLGKDNLARLVDRFNSTLAGTKTSRGQLIPTLRLPARYELGDNYISQDLRLSRAFVFRERYRLLLIGEVFNLLNILNPEQKEALEKCARARSLPVRLVERARIVLLAAAGKQDKEIAAALDITAHKVARWRNRFLDFGMPGLEKDAPRPGRTPRISAAQVKRVIHKTTQEKPANATHWSTRSMAAAVGLSDATVRRIWHKHGLKPHLLETFKISSDPHFAEKLEAIVGLYLNPPEHALVLCCDEKSQIQALDRTQPGLPLKPGRAGTMTHDYKRNGTATLFAALNTLDGKVISLCQQRHRHQEWVHFLRLVDNATPAHQQLHLIVDNYATHKHPTVQRWLKRHPRFHIHFTPTSASWLNMVERFFRDLTANRLRRGVFRYVLDLVSAIDDYVDHHNQHPKPFIWTASANDILEKVKRARKTLVTVQSV